MPGTSPVVIKAGFSFINRVLLYTSLLSSPAVCITGMSTNLPVGFGFLGYTMYQQYTLFLAVRQKQLHALCLLPQYLNTLYSLAYMGGVSAGNHMVSGVMCLGTIASLIANLVTTWMDYFTNMPEGDGVYIFYLFGYRTLTPTWRKVFLGWAVLNTILTVIFIVVSIYLAIAIPSEKGDMDEEGSLMVDTSLIWGSCLGLVLFWPVIVWTEMIVRKNNIASETDMISVYMFIVQIAMLAIPSICRLLCGVCG